MVIPQGLIKIVDIDIRIVNGFLPEKSQAIAQTLQADNGKAQMEFSDCHQDPMHTIDGEVINQAARAYANPDKFISTWEGEPGNPSSLGVLVNYNRGVEGKTLRKATGGNDFFGIANQKDVNRVMPQIEQIWPGIRAR